MSFRYKIISTIILGTLLLQSVFPQKIESNKKNQYQFGFPLIKNYLPKDYKAANQNWAIAQDKRGVIYFGNSTGVLEFDGHYWNLIKIKNDIVRSLAVDDKGTLFIGSADDLGYLVYDKIDGTKKYKSLLPFIPTKEPFGHIWQTFYINKCIYFISKSHIFEFKFENNDYNKPKVKFWKSTSRFRLSFNVNNKLYIVTVADGLVLFENDQLKKIPGSEIFIDNPAFSMLPYDNNGDTILVTTNNGKMYLYDGLQFNLFKSEAEDYILQNHPYFPGAKLPDDTFVLNTTRGGIIIIDKQGNIIRKINLEAGLPDDGVLYTYYSNNKLWLALQNGISYIDLPSPITYFNQNSGLKGSISDFKIYNDNPYAASTAGIFKLQTQNSQISKSSFREISKVAQESWQFTTFKDQIIVALTDGVYQVNDNSVVKLSSKFTRCYSIYSSSFFPNRIYTGLENGLAVLDYSENKWIDHGKITGINSAVRYIEEDSKGNVWLGTSYNGVYKLSNFNSNFDKQPNVEHFKNQDLFVDEEVKIFKSINGLLFCTKSKTFVFDESKNTFIPEKELGLNDYLGKAEVLYILTDKSENLWVSAIRNKSELTIARATKTKNNKYVWKELSFLKSVIDFSNSMAVFSIYKDEKTGFVWFSGSDGIVNLDTRFLNDSINTLKPILPLIRKVSVNRDSLIFAGDDLTRLSLGLENEFQLPSNLNLIRFDFSSMTYEGNLTSYKFKLDGFDDDWSEWTSEHRKDYTNLAPGNYKFRVKAKNIFNVVSNESTFEFEILTPWYLSSLAYFIYIISVIALLLFILNYRLKYLEQKNINLELIIDQRTRQIKEQAEKLKVLDEVKSRFFTNISHEFRTPLTLTMGQIESVMSVIQDFSLKNKLEMGLRNAKKLLKMINQILEISKIESGKHSLTVVKKDIVSFTRHLFSSFESLADQKGIRLEFYSDNDINFIYFNSEKMEEIIINLTSNAIKFTAEGGVIKLKIETKKSFDIQEKSILQITLEDSGIGIPKDRLPYIFDRFYQVERMGTPDIEGTGIGLTLVKELVELHSGTIEVESEVNKGTKFTIRFLLGKDHFNRGEIIDDNIKDDEQYEENLDLIESASEDELTKTEAETTNKESVLIIDDNADIRKFIFEQLEPYYLVYQASDGENGLKEAKEQIPDLIITDVRMPKIDGFELTKRLKDDTLTSHIPVIILTAKVDQKDKLFGLETGADDYLVKPFNHQELLIRVKNLIAIRKKLREKYKKTSFFKPDEVSNSSIDQKFLEKVMEEINKNYTQEKFNAEKLADDCAISVSQLNRKLNALIGQPAGHLIRGFRMEKAAQMLINDETSIKEIGYLVGFSDQSSFARSFKKYFGKSPGEFTKS